jgi:cholest-4-en-3-one 26-monooxygenase
MSQVVTGDLEDLVQIEDPGFYDEPHPILTRLRAEAPVFLYKPLDCWVLSKYEDIRLVGRSPEIFSSAQGFLLNDIRYGNITKENFAAPGSEFLSTSDPPRHRELRRMVSPSLTPRALRSFEDSIRENCIQLLDRITPGDPIDFVNEIASVLPIGTIARFFGVPAEYADSLRFWGDEFLKAGAALSREQIEEAGSNVRDMARFFNEWLIRKIGSDDADMLCDMLKVKASRPDLNYETLHMFLAALLTGGIETTRDFLSTSLLAFSHNPAQLENLRSDIPGYSERAVEECLRWVTPVHGFVRTVTQDTEIRGTEIKAGQHVQMLWTSGNRDEDIWAGADQFDITRPPDPSHLAFGFGEHSCLGAALARLQGRVFFEEIAQRFSSWHQAGDAVRPHSVLHNSYESLPLAFSV